MIFTIMASDFRGSDTESVPDLEFLMYIFNPDLSDTSSRLGDNRMLKA